MIMTIDGWIAFFMLSASALMLSVEGVFHFYTKSAKIFSMIAAIADIK